MMFLLAKLLDVKYVYTPLSMAPRSLNRLWKRRPRRSKNGWLTNFAKTPVVPCRRKLITETGALNKRRSRCLKDCY